MECFVKRIQHVSVKKLFGYDGNDYEVKIDSDSSITFIYAFNGSGKTTLFRLIYAALKKQLTILDSISFESLRICFNNGEQLVVKKYINKPFDEIMIGEFQKDETNQYYFPIVYEWRCADNSVREGKFYFKGESVLRVFGNDEYKHYPFFLDEKTKKQIKLDMFYCGGYVQDLAESNILIDNELLDFMNVDILYANKDYDRLITQQIIRRRNDDGEQILGMFENYNTLDMVSLPFKYVKKIMDTRINEINTMGDVTLPEFMTRHSECYDTEEKYISFQIPDKTKIMQERFKYFISKEYLIQLEIRNPNYRSDYIREEQFSLFEDIINNNSELTEKKLHINRETGEIEIRVLDQEELLPIEKLSSGEKNLLLMYFYVIFIKNTKGILFIDEPEVSLHIDWQQRLAKNLMKICDKTKLQVIIATHSPAIINDNFLLMSEFKRVR